MIATNGISKKITMEQLDALLRLVLASKVIFIQKGGNPNSTTFKHLKTSYIAFKNANKVDNSEKDTREYLKKGVRLFNIARGK